MKEVSYTTIIHLEFMIIIKVTSTIYTTPNDTFFFKLLMFTFQQSNQVETHYTYQTPHLGSSTWVLQRFQRVRIPRFSKARHNAYPSNIMDYCYTHYSVQDP